MGNKHRNKSKKGNIMLTVAFLIVAILIFIEISVAYEVSLVYREKKTDMQEAEAEPVHRQIFGENLGTAKWDKLYEEKAVKMDRAHKDRLEEIKEREAEEKKNGTNPDKKSPEDKAVENKKIAYLTFDDGPSQYVTPQILDILNSYGVKATFFVLGKQAEINPHLLKRIHQEGHAIGNHTYSHNYGFLYKDVENFLYELEKTAHVLKNILGDDFETNIIRFPGGSFGAKRAPFRKFVVEKGYNYIDWNCINGDAEGHYLPAQKLYNRFKGTFKNQKELIVLLHDADGKITTAQALPNIIEFLIERGYEFGTF